MTDVKHDRVWDLTESEGLGDYTLQNSAPTSYRTFYGAGVATSETVVVCVIGRTTGVFETVRGTYNRTANTLSRDTWIDGPTGAFVDWGPEIKDVLLIASASQIPTTEDLSWALRVDVASASTCAIAAAGSNYVGITGATTITAFDTPVNGNSYKFIRFEGVLTLTHAASTLNILGGESVTTSAGMLALAVYEGSSLWRVTILSPAPAATAANLRTGTNTTKPATAAGLFAAAAPVAVAYSATVTLDLSTGLNFEIGALTGNLTLANPSAGMDPGRSGAIGLLQDGTGSRTITLGSQWDHVGGAPVLSTAAGTQDCLYYYVVTSTVIRCSLGKAYA